MSKVLNRPMFNSQNSAYGRGITSNLVSEEQRVRYNTGGRVGFLTGSEVNPNAWLKSIGKTAGTAGTAGAAGYGASKIRLPALYKPGWWQKIKNLGAMTAGLQQQGFQQAQQARQQDYQNQLGLAQYQQGMEGQRIQGMAQLGQTDIGYRQAMADTLAKQNQLAAYEPYQRTGFMGEQLAGLMGGYPGGSRMQSTPTASPVQQGISTGLGALMGYAGFKNLMGQ